jgi:hypothetical protein
MTGDLRSDSKANFPNVGPQMAGLSREGAVKRGSQY